MSAVTIEESEDERSIVTPDLRLRFRKRGDRWTHAIDLGPGPWQTLADSLDATGEDLDDVARPVFQDLHFQHEQDAVVALAIGQSGAHHFSASFRVSFRAYRVSHPTSATILQDRSESEVLIDVADRCRAVGKKESHYLVRKPMSHTFLGDSRDQDQPTGYSTEWRACLVWETDRPDNYDVHIRAVSDPAASRVSIVRRTVAGDYHVRAAPVVLDKSGTQRCSYIWGHHRVNAFEKPRDSGRVPPWSLEGCAAPRDL